MILKAVKKNSFFYYLSECDSTNDFLLKRRDLLEIAGFSLYTLNQKNGRGYGSNPWYSPEGNLAYSMVLHAKNKEAAQLLPIRVGFILYQILSNYKKNLKIKWPNDILEVESKLAGILCEAKPEILYPPAVVVVVGIGINLKPLPVKIDRPVSYINANGHELAWQLTLALRNLSFADKLSPEFIAGWEKAAQLPQKFYCKRKNKTLVFEKLLPDGSILTDKKEIIQSKESLQENYEPIAENTLV